jgi:hypothetical protein
MYGELMQQILTRMTQPVEKWELPERIEGEAVGA